MKQHAIVKYPHPLTDADIERIRHEVQEWQRRGGTLIMPADMHVQVRRLNLRPRPFGAIAAHAHKVPHA